jgi:predicted TIM-barrel fold metal-dependent hydrolase
MDRRTFLAQALLVGGGSRLAAQSALPWGTPVLDIHLHPRREFDGEIQHMTGSGVTKAVVLAPASAQARIAEKMQKQPGQLFLFTSVNVAEPDSIEILTRSVKSGAIGIGELKSRVTADGPEMCRVYELAADLNVPVLIHFQDFPQFDGDGTYNAGITRFPAILKRYPKTIFIGHGDSFWANISADVPEGVSYPTGPVKLGGLTDRMLADYPNLYGDLSANSGRNALGRDTEFTEGFLKRHSQKLLFGCDCSCTDGQGTGQRSQQPLIKGKCVARETLGAVKRHTTPEVFRRITWENGGKLLKIG